MNDERLEEILDRWEQARQAGCGVTLDELCADCPDLRSAVAQRIQALEAFAGLLNHSQPLGDDQAGRSTEGTGDKSLGRTGAGGASAERSTSLPQLEQFEIQEHLGTGGMGVVYKARNRITGDAVALKTLPGVSPRDVYRFKQEFRTLAGIRHPHLVRLYELYCVAGRWFFTMELLSGLDPFQHLCGLGRTASDPASLPNGSAPEYESTLRRILAELAEGLCFLHDTGVIHRDLKCSNVLVTSEPRTVILDFGLAAQIDRTGGYQSVDANVKGTFAYMSPEQAASQPLTPATDWYSVGVMLYRWLTGRVPFSGSPHRILLEKQHVDPPPPAALVSHVPPALNELCMRLLSRSPDERPTGDEVRRQLQHGRPGTAARPAAPERAAHRPRSRQLLGREEELQTLNQLYAGMRRGEAVLADIQASAGCGKTALVDEFLEWTVRAEALVFRGRCYQHESVPYKAIDGLVDDLAQFLSRRGRTEVEAVLPRDVYPLLTTFPVLRQVEALSSSPRWQHRGEQQRLRERAFAGLAELLARVGDRHPLVLVIDDVQWGDIDSLGLFEALLDSRDMGRHLLVLCGRTEDAVSSGFTQGLAELLKRFPQKYQHASIQLGPLSPSAAQAVALRILGSAEDAEAAARRIAAEAEGSPFLIQELARWWLSRRAELAALRNESLSLGAALCDRYNELPAAARNLLDVILVAAQPIETAVAEAASAAQVNRAAWDCLESGGFIRFTVGERPTAEVYHDRLRETLLARLEPEVIRAVHQRIGEALEETGSRDYERLAKHFRQTSEQVKTVRYLTLAADQAAQSLAFAHACDLYRLVLPLDPHNPDLLIAAAEALANAGFGAESAGLYLKAAEGPPLPDRLEPIELQRRAALQLMISGRVDEGSRVLDDVLAQTRLWRPRSSFGLLIGLLLNRVFTPKPRGNCLPRPKSQALKQSLEQQIDTAWTALVGYSIVDPIRATYYHGLSLRLAQRSRDPLRIAMNLAWAGGLYATPGPRAERRVSAYLAAAQQLTDQLDSPLARAWLCLSQAGAELMFGKWRACVASADQAEELFTNRCRGATWEVDTARSFACWSLGWLGDTEELSRRLRRHVREADVRGDLYALSNLQAAPVACYDYLARDDRDGARSELDLAKQRLNQGGYHVQHHNAVLAEVTLALYDAEGERALSTIAAFIPAFRRSLLFLIQQVRVDFVQCHARSAILAGLQSQRGDHWRLAGRLVGKLRGEDARWARAFGELLEAPLLLRAGRREAAVASLEAARDGFEEAEMKLHVAAARYGRAAVLGEIGQNPAEDGTLLFERIGIKRFERMVNLLVPGLLGAAR